MKKYDIFRSSNSVDATKDWRDAFLESFESIKNTCLKERYSGADCLYVDANIGGCTKLTPLIAYVSQFRVGGFWYRRNFGIYFVTSGTDSDVNATYNDALIFCANWKIQRKIMKEKLTKQQLKRLTKKQLVNMAEYRNIKEFCLYNQYMTRSAKKAPSKKAIINYIF